MGHLVRQAVFCNQGAALMNKRIVILCMLAASVMGACQGCVGVGAGIVVPPAALVADTQDGRLEIPLFACLYVPGQDGLLCQYEDANRCALAMYGNDGEEPTLYRCKQYYVQGEDGGVSL